MKKEQLEVFATAGVCMDMYKKKYDEAFTEKKERFSKLNANYRKGSPMFLEERNRITPEFEQKIEDARREFLSEFEDVLDRTIAHEKAAVTSIEGSVKSLNNMLDSIADTQMTIDEYEALVQNYGNKFYWLDRKFEQIAEKSGIIDTLVQPGVTTKLAILDELSTNVRKFINEYDGETKLFPGISSDKYLYTLEEKYTNGYSNVKLNNKEQAKRLVSEALSKHSSLERSCILSNLIRSSEPEMQEEILSVLAEKDHTILSEPIMKLLGVQSILEDFKEKELANIKAADAAMEKINNAKSHQERIGVIYDNVGNKHFRKLTEELISNTGDVELKNTYENAKESQKAAGSEKCE